MKQNNCKYYKGNALCHHSDRNFLCYFVLDPYACPDFEEGDYTPYKTPSAKLGEKGGICLECENPLVNTNDEQSC